MLLAMLYTCFRWKSKLTFFTRITLDRFSWELIFLLCIWFLRWHHICFLFFLNFLLYLFINCFVLVCYFVNMLYFFLYYTMGSKSILSNCFYSAPHLFSIFLLFCGIELCIDFCSYILFSCSSRQKCSTHSYQRINKSSIYLRHFCFTSYCRQSRNLTLTNMLMYVSGVVKSRRQGWRFHFMRYNWFLLIIDFIYFVYEIYKINILLIFVIDEQVDDELKVTQPWLIDIYFQYVTLHLILYCFCKS